ncbi:NAD-dependent epimerase/dehydratase family protein [Wenyingzhuangia marina]|uniref:NAD dependent epimerase/dehydratase family protein n=1 Tax=Wenyingzhuangia marina TaxID=1195760 RepID=A0A1M5TY86_9FLAO|nr:NAD-dependent epimerase/dehydratase family protein [Wenyingzhuangia marina]GGF70483.1 epimerase [Wenyingzhuangia marina]SHH55638.1 NAD dependent epimerase/dehydratase family protein [Wenyingzhuangia marina]
MKKVIITGSTGMVGKAVLYECLESVDIEKILLINRRSLELKDDKIHEVILKDFSEVESIKNEMNGYDACFHCMGISSIGLNEEEFSKVTFEYTKKLTDVLYQTNPNMVVNYVSGKGTDSTEKGNVMWARVKGKTENYILNKGFKDAYMIRLGAILPEKGISSKTFWYNIIYVLLRPFFPLLKKSKNILTTTSFGKAMINTLFFPQENKHLENKDMNSLALKHHRN